MVKKKDEPGYDWQRTSVVMDRKVHKRALKYKVDSGKELGEILTEALDEYLKRRGA